jgi:hypothetical protein
MDIGCGLKPNELQGRGGGRVHLLSGHIHTGHPLAKASAPYAHQQFRSDAFLMRKLIRPISPISTIVNDTVTRLRHDGASIIGVQMRTGYADLPSSSYAMSTSKAAASHVPDYAQFLAPGDELRFINHVHTLLSDRFRIPLEQHRLPFVAPAGDTTTATTTITPAPIGARIFVMTDSGVARRAMIAEFGDRVITTNGPIMHTGLALTHGHTQSTDGLYRTLVDWFTFTHANHAIVTSWSLFGSSALEYAGVYDAISVDHSLCGQKGHKPCR